MELRRHLRQRASMLCAAVAIDLLAGEPPAAVHPVVQIGRMIGGLERRAPKGSPIAQLLYGAAMTVAVTGASALVATAVERWSRRSPLGIVASAVLLKSLFSVRLLLQSTDDVRRPLAMGDLGAARGALRSLVSRRTEDLDLPLIAAAAIESLAENLTDSALAPWLAYAGFGLPGIAAYRALNTLDSMIGYRGRFEYLGKVAARADDVANLVPARIGAVLIALAAPLGSGSSRRSLSTAVRDHGRTESPNAGWTMAAMAGALGVELEKAGAYRLGDGRPPGHGDIRRAEQVAAAALALGAAGAIGVAWLASRTPRGR